MKQKIILCCLLLLFTAGCFSATEWLLGSTTKEEKEVVPANPVPGSVIFVQGPRYVHYNYQYQYWPPRWWYRWWLDTGERCWWLDYNIDPVYWPRPRPRVELGPRVEHLPRVPNPTVLKRNRIIERRTMIPRYTKASIDRYVDSGTPTAGFLHAVLSNDLFEAAAKADENNRPLLADICKYIYNYTPSVCYGSPEKVTAWLKFHEEKPEEARQAASADRERRELYNKRLRTD